MDQRIKKIASGGLVHRSGKEVSYTITNGWDIRSSMECDRQWKQATLQLLDEIAAQNFDTDRLMEVVGSVSMEDDHWKWFEKAINFTSEQYEWFHLYAEEKPQGACVIFHPKESALTGNDIFYVEFIAVAPWNRDNLLRKRIFRGVGRALLKAALKYSVECLRLKPGFCLHSLPGAQNFYSGLEMVRVAAKDKKALTYFELPAASAATLMEVS